MPHYKVEVVKYVTETIEHIHQYRVFVAAYGLSLDDAKERVDEELEHIMRVGHYTIKKIELDKT